MTTTNGTGPPNEMIQQIKINRFTDINAIEQSKIMNENELYFFCILESILSHSRCLSRALHYISSPIIIQTSLITVQTSDIAYNVNVINMSCSFIVLISK